VHNDNWWKDMRDREVLPINKSGMQPPGVTNIEIRHMCGIAWVLVMGSIV